MPWPESSARVAGNSQTARRQLSTNVQSLMLSASLPGFSSRWAAQAALPSFVRRS